MTKNTKPVFPDFNRDLKEYQTVRKKALCQGAANIGVTLAIGGMAIAMNSNIGWAFTVASAYATDNVIGLYKRSLQLRRDILKLHLEHNK